MRVALFAYFLYAIFGISKSYCQNVKTNPSISSLEWNDVKGRIYPMLKQTLPFTDSTPGIQLIEDEEPALENFLMDIQVMYLIDFDSFYSYISKGQLKKWRISIDSLKRTAISNLDQLAEGKAQLHEGKEYGMVILNGNLEASLLLSTNFWSNLLGVLKYEELIVGVPARDMLLIANGKNEESIAQLGEAIKRTYALGDNVISKWMFQRVNGVWVNYKYVE